MGNKIYMIAGIAAIALIGFFVLSAGSGNEMANAQSLPGPIHWHPRLEIEINGEQQAIPSNIGIVVGNNIDNQVSGMKMSPIHTHEPDGTLHLEQQFPNTETVKLGYFFKVWGKKFNEECIFEYCNGAQGTVKMLVNGKENLEFENYSMKDVDIIKIIFE